jgi:hypothetical protein
MVNNAFEYDEPKIDDEPFLKAELKNNSYSVNQSPVKPKLSSQFKPERIVHNSRTESIIKLNQVS